MNFDEELEEELELESLSKKDLALIENDYTIPISDDPIKEIKFLIDCYSKIIELDPEIEYEEEMKNYSLNVIRAILCEYELPIDDLWFFFIFTLEIELLRSKYSKLTKDAIMGGDSSAADNFDSLFVRLNEYLQEQPNLFCDPEIYDSIFDVDKHLTKTKLYKTVLQQCYEDLLYSGTNASLETIIQLYNEDRPMSDEYLERTEIPAATLEEFKVAFHLITDNSKQGPSIKKHYKLLKTIINEKFSFDPELAAWLDLQKRLETIQLGREFSGIKWGTLIVIAFIALNSGAMIMTILIFGGIWWIIFFSALGEKIPYIRKRKEAHNNTK